MIVGSKIVSEKMIVIKDLGIQIETNRLKGSTFKRFVDISRVRDIVINEVSRLSL